ncbi:MULTISPECIES: alpha/beta fold hydrolase [unclassified Crossiella]|uniref:alpha/beta fold hydrolase n=1 Tax=unclassified Crossiella TaxID=2620835 RepID=UPI001FFFFEBD|nr:MULTISPECIES: alpha/beta hydrolase [unclassified Crossiella]MCK2236688.1 alpha/beta hydrolase [Crossiella sp. S99.2]MCK2250356.1 alpha/beta hydrolase [Crossiella sp. S99.1]
MTTTITGHGGTRLALRTAGPVGAPALVLLHGWAQSSAVWRRLLADPGLTERYRLLAPDLRGHGDSEAPESGYDDPAAWAGDLAAVLEHASGPAVVLGWSYGGLVIADYLRVCGDAGLAGIVLVGAVTEIGPDRPGGATGPVMTAGLREMLSPDDEVARPALREFIASGTAVPMSQDEQDRQLGTALATPAAVRKAVFKRDIGSAEALTAVTVPTLVLHGDSDEVVLPVAGRYAADTVPGAAASWYPGCGHAPFLERPADFDVELAHFLTRCHVEHGKMGL